MVNMRISKSATPRSLAVSIALSYTPGGRSCTDSTVLGLDLTADKRKVRRERESSSSRKLVANRNAWGMPGSGFGILALVIQHNQNSGTEENSRIVVFDVHRDALTEDLRSGPINLV